MMELGEAERYLAGLGDRAEEAVRVVVRAELARVLFTPQVKEPTLAEQHLAFVEAVRKKEGRA